MKRPARFAGSWYPGTEDALRSAVEGYIARGGKASPAIGLMAPHAGYVYSGGIAGLGFAAVEVTASVVVLSPKHTHAGAAISVWDGDAWQTPLGEVAIDEKLREAILSRSEEAEADHDAHLGEHALELELPFLQVRRPDVRIVPIAVGYVGVDSLRALGEACAESVKEATEGGRALIVASSDMTHHEPADAAKKHDDRALERFVALDPEGLYDVVRGEGISMCGVGPVTAMLFASVALGATRAEVIAYATSGEVTGDHDSVVGYAAAVVSA